MHPVKTMQSFRSSWMLAILLVVTFVASTSGIIDACQDDEFECLDGECIELSRKCDNIIDCPGGWDEKSCESVRPKPRYFCPDGKFTCADLSCISIVGRCNGKVDCPRDRSDEEGCRMLN